MEPVTGAIRAYFEARNRAWIDGRSSSMRDASKTDRTQDDLPLDYSVKLTRRSFALRNLSLLRAHSKVKVLSLRPSPDVKNAVDVKVQERVNWVYADGPDYRVESRAVVHRQRWVEESSGWHLNHAVESSEALVVGKQSDRVEEPAALPVVPLGRWPRQTCTRYDRERVLRYADLWWDGFNPEYMRFADDCTNFISQCLHAGSMQMAGGHRRSSGWWYRREKGGGANWSYSWAVSNALHGFLVRQPGVVRVNNPKDLKLGDIIFYDWAGNGQFHHSTVVTDFDFSGDPLVNAHTDASFHRHYLYRDSRAWTDHTRYDFLHLPDDLC